MLHVKMETGPMTWCLFKATFLRPFSGKRWLQNSGAEKNF